MRDKKYILCTKREKDTYTLGRQLAKLNFRVVCLTGDLGCGKTVLAKGYAKELGIREHITSPTFNIINKYENDDITLYHMDAYRITEESMLDDLGFEEIFDHSSYVIVEWANNISNSISDEAIWIEMKKDEDDVNIRYITIHCHHHELEQIGNIRIC